LIAHQTHHPSPLLLQVQRRYTNITQPTGHESRREAIVSRRKTIYKKEGKWIISKNDCVFTRYFSLSKREQKQRMAEKEKTKGFNSFSYTKTTILGFFIHVWTIFFGCLSFSPFFPHLDDTPTTTHRVYIPHLIHYYSQQ
jgi:hypothetical protein